MLPKSIILLLALHTVNLAETIRLDDGVSQLHGEIQSINATGTLALKSPISKNSILLNDQQIREITFDQQPQPLDSYSTLITLQNADQISCAIQSLDEKDLSIKSQDLGIIRIPRKYIKSAHLHVTPNNLIYSGPRSLQEWTPTHRSNLENWSYTDGKLTAITPASITTNISLPEQFTLKFKLNWRAAHTPNFQMLFADSADSSRPYSNAYRFSFNSSGVSLSRDNGTLANTIYIAQLNRTPDLYSDRQLEVEIHTDRKKSTLLLVINHHTEGLYFDPSPNTPQGRNITLISENTGSTISDIKVTTYNNRPNSENLQKPSDSDKDTILSHLSDSWTGRILNSQETQGQMFFHFCTFPNNDVIAIPEADISTIFFTFPPIPPSNQHFDGLFEIRLNDSTTFKSSSYHYDGFQFTLDHPLIGPIQLRKEQLISIRKITQFFQTHSSDSK